MKEHSVYRRIASALTVIEIAEPIRWRFETGTKLGDAYEEIMEEDSAPCVVLVLRDASPIGFLEFPGCFTRENAGSPVEEVATNIDIWRVVSAETTIFDLIPLWQRSYYFFVLEGTRISHFVARHDVDKAPVKAALFSLTAELEERMLRLLMADREQIKTRFERLELKRQKAAKRLIEKKKQPEHPVAYIQNTYFSDKVEMFLATPELASLLPFHSETESRHFFGFIGDLRNELAHGGSLFNVIRDASELKEIIDATENVLSRLR